jgi:hypothetical protein
MLARIHRQEGLARRARSFGRNADQASSIASRELDMLR